MDNFDNDTTEDGFPQSDAGRLAKIRRTAARWVEESPGTDWAKAGHVIVEICDGRRYD